MLKMAIIGVGATKEIIPNFAKISDFRILRYFHSPPIIVISHADPNNTNFADKSVLTALTLGFA